MKSLAGQIHTEAILGIEAALGAMSVEGRTIRKLRIRILPLVFLLFVVALLDRVNIGFAALIQTNKLHKPRLVIDAVKPTSQNSFQITKLLGS